MSPQPHVTCPESCRGFTSLLFPRQDSHEAPHPPKPSIHPRSRPRASFEVQTHALTSRNAWQSPGNEERQGQQSTWSKEQGREDTKPCFLQGEVRERLGLCLHGWEPFCILTQSRPGRDMEPSTAACCGAAGTGWSRPHT